MNVAKGHLVADLEENRSLLGLRSMPEARKNGDPMWRPDGSHRPHIHTRPEKEAFDLSSTTDRPAQRGAASVTAKMKGMTEEQIERRWENGSQTDEWLQRNNIPSVEQALPVWDMGVALTQQFAQVQAKLDQIGDKLQYHDQRFERLERHVLQPSPQQKPQGLMDWMRSLVPGNT